MFELRKNKKRILAVICALLLCLSLLCSCGKDEPQGSSGNAGTASHTAQSGASEVKDIYELPVFEDLPETYADITPAFWKAENPNGGVMYLLGSIHVGDKSAYRMPQQIMDAYLASDSLTVEVDTIALVDDEARMESCKVLTTYPDGDNLKNHIDPLLYEEIVEFLQTYSDDPEVISRLKNRMPCTWLTELGAIDEAASGLSADYGIDDYFLKLAHAQGKEIIEIESAESQYNTLNSIPDMAYEYLLGMYIQTPDTLGLEIRQLYEEWKAGTIQSTTDPAEDAAAIEEDPFGFAAAIAEYNRVTFTDRNVTMANAAKSYLEDGKNVFFVVGTEHLLGSTGVIASLEAEGYKVTRIEY